MNIRKILRSELGLGCMGMSDLYGPADRAKSIETIHNALDTTIALLDTGDFYGMGDNEMLLREALAGRPRESYLLSVKFGALRGPDGSWFGSDLRPVAIKNFLAYSLKRLGTDYIDIYRPARLDPAVPIEEVVGTLGELVQAGYIKQIGLSEVGADSLRRAQAVHPIVDMQIEYSLLSRGIETEILPTARELGIGITAYGVLSRGLLSGRWEQNRTLSPQDFRGFSPRFQGDNLAHNLALVETLRGIATSKQTTVAALAIAWVRAQGEDILPLIGARTPERLTEACAATTVTLSAADLAQIEAAIPKDAAAGERYHPSLMAHLDSEH
jgi:aryl-alcohol dehydrogenase-like predicted oxidoreductase